MAISLVIALMRYFGRKHGQGIKEFADEVRALSNEDREGFAVLLTKELGEEVRVKI